MGEKYVLPALNMTRYLEGPRRYLHYASFLLFSKQGLLFLSRSALGVRDSQASFDGAKVTALRVIRHQNKIHSILDLRTYSLFPEFLRPSHHSPKKGSEVVDYEVCLYVLPLIKQG